MSATADLAKFLGLSTDGSSYLWPVLLCTAAAVLAVASWRLWVSYKARYSYYNAPSPTVRAPWWLLGNVEVVERVTDRHQLYKEWHERFGPFVRIRIAHRSMLMVADPAAAASILVKGPGYVAQKPPEYTAFDVAHGLQGYNGMLTHQDEGTWRAVRKAIMPAFALNEVKKRYPVILGCLDDLINDLDQNVLDKTPTPGSGYPQSHIAAAPAGADSVDTPPVINGTVLSSDSRTEANLPQISSADFEIEHHMLVAANKMMARGLLQLPEGFIELHQMARDVGFLMETASRFICEPWRWVAHLYLPFITQEGRRMWTARRRLAAAAERIYDLLQDRYKDSPPAETDNSLAACLTRVTDKHGRKPKRGALVAEICDALTASETVPSTVMWTLYCIVTTPGLQQQLQQELAAADISATGHVSGTTQQPTVTAAYNDAADSGNSINSSDQSAGPQSISMPVLHDTGVPRDLAANSQTHQHAQQPTANGLSAAYEGAQGPGDASLPKHWSNSSDHSETEGVNSILQQRRQRLLEQFAAAGTDLFKQLPLLQACLYEAMRIYPAGAPGAPRLTQAPTQVGPYLVPPGVLVFPNIFAIMNYSHNWEQPEKFDPSRWSGPFADKDPSTGAARWVPFSIGPKACAGQNLALLQCKAALASLLSAYQWKLSPSMGGEQGVAARTYLGVTIKVRDGLWFTGTPRV